MTPRDEIDAELHRLRTGGGPRAAERPAFYAYVVVDAATDPPTPLAVRMSRLEAREVVQGTGVVAADRDGRKLRIRRAKVTLYES